MTEVSQHAGILGARRAAALLPEVMHVLARTDGPGSKTSRRRRGAAASYAQGRHMAGRRFRPRMQ
ncbi:hypothetical protein XarjCFBP7653_18550 [Xanthomonas arboricola]|nr:hypothetical protein XarjCFBP7653_18550 [Xanthomonas arboricola]